MLSSFIHKYYSQTSTAKTPPPPIPSVLQTFRSTSNPPKARPAVFATSGIRLSLRPYIGHIYRKTSLVLWKRNICIVYIFCKSVLTPVHPRHQTGASHETLQRARVPQLVWGRLQAPGLFQCGSRQLRRCPALCCRFSRAADPFSRLISSSSSPSTAGNNRFSPSDKQRHLQRP